MDHYDVAVIGAGPAGSMAAKYAAIDDAHTVLIEEHDIIGWPVECAGLLGKKAMEESELALGKFVVNEFKGARVYSPNACVSFKADSPKAWAVDRRLFDRALGLEAAKAGVEIRLNSAVRKLRREKDACVLVMNDGEKIKAGVVISAEGVRARIARQAGIGPVEKVLSGAQVEVPFSIDDAELVEVYFGQVPGLFAWVVPISNKSARIGLCTDQEGCTNLKTFLQKDFIQKRMLGSVVSLVVGGLPMGPPTSTAADRFLAVGDSCGQVKPTSGGGIYPGLVCAKIAGRVAAAAVHEGDCSEKRLREYDRSWRALLGRELEVGMRVNKLLNKMNEKDLDEAIAFLAKRPQMLKVIEEHGDIDRPSILMTKMLSNLGFDGIKLIRLLRYALA